MNATRAGARATLPNVWMIRLPCGHEVPVPWGSAAPAQVACVVRHQTECVEPLGGTASSWWAPPIDHPALADRP